VKHDVNVNRMSCSDVRGQALKYKIKASEEFHGKYIAILGATFTNNFDEFGSERATLEFIDNDEIIAQYLKEFSLSEKSCDESEVNSGTLEGNIVIYRFLLIVKFY
jgi:hypothetical protein